MEAAPAARPEATETMALSEQIVETSPLPPDREKLRGELIALYHQYRGDADQAASMQARFEAMMDNVRQLLNAEFPDWDVSAESDRQTSQ
jgi:hypothetical protein